MDIGKDASVSDLRAFVAFTAVPAPWSTLMHEVRGMFTRLKSRQYSADFNEERGTDDQSDCSS